MLGADGALRHKVLVEGQSQRRVAREMGLARDTAALPRDAGAGATAASGRGRPVLERCSCASTN